MAKSIGFHRVYAAFGPKVRDFEHGKDVLTILTDLVNDLDQTIGAYIGGTFSVQWLQEADAEGSKSDLDLLLLNQEDGFVDIILRRSGEPSRYGGFLNGGELFRILDEFVEGHRVIEGKSYSGTVTRYEMTGDTYQPIGPTATKLRLGAGRAKYRRAVGWT